jgi:hypothetical protein
VVRDEAGRARAIELAGYFDNIDGQVETWWFGELPQEERERVKPFRTPRFHRTLSAWVEMTTAAGLRVEKLGEPMATEEAARRYPAVEDTRVAPLFLLVRGRKG